MIYIDGGRLLVRGMVVGGWHREGRSTSSVNGYSLNQSHINVRRHALSNLTLIITFLIINWTLFQGTFTSALLKGIILQGWKMSAYQVINPTACVSTIYDSSILVVDGDPCPGDVIHPFHVAMPKQKVKKTHWSEKLLLAAASIFSPFSSSSLARDSSLPWEEGCHCQPCQPLQFTHLCGEVNKTPS